VVTAPHDSPDAIELLAAVRAFLQRDLLTATPGRLQLHLQVAIHPLATETRDDPAFLHQIRDVLESHRLAMPMLCCSPDFTQPDAVLLRREVELEKRMIELTAFFGGRYCRVLSGQRRPGLDRKDGVAQVVRVIKSLLPFAEQHEIILTIENHYKDNYWEYPEFAQKMDVFTEIVDQIESPWFGVNFDPSNALLAGEDPLVLLQRVKDRVVTMHASDRYLKSGTIEDLQREENSAGYAS
jgi:sugar phosphate isomerase/epimerase